MKQVLPPLEWTAAFDNVVQFFQFAGIDTDGETELEQVAVLAGDLGLFQFNHIVVCRVCHGAISAL